MNLNYLEQYKTCMAFLGPPLIRDLSIIENMNIEVWHNLERPDRQQVIQNRKTSLINYYCIKYRLIYPGDVKK